MDRRRSPRPQHILVVDDSDDVRALWAAWLTLWGFTVAEARDGNEAIRIALAQKPHAVLMDLWMPRVDGITAMERLRGEAATADVPIIVLTADPSHLSLARARRAGCDAYVAKPLAPEALLDHLRATLAKARPADKE